MSFLSGWRLLFLLAPIALLAAYLLVQRRRHAQVVRFTSVDLLDSVAPQRSGWQRHLPAAGVLLSLVAMVWLWQRQQLSPSALGEVEAVRLDDGAWQALDHG